MTEEPAQVPLVGGVALLERAVSYTLGSLHQVTGAAMHRPTPCREWDLGQLLAHMNDSLTTLHEAVSVGMVGLDGTETVGPPSRDPVGALRQRACRLLGEWAGADDPGVISVAGCPVTTGVVMGAGAVEITVHGWDVAQACGVRRDIPASLAEELLELVPMFVTDADRPGRFAASVPLDPRYGAGERLVAFLGRVPG